MGRRTLAEIKYVIFHHDAAMEFDGRTNVIPRYVSEANYHIGKGWKHLGYSFKISREGKVYQTVPYEEIGVHAGNGGLFRNSLGVCLDGSFDKQAPSEAQKKAVKDLMYFFAHKSPNLPNVVEKSMYAHREIRGVGFPGTKFFIPSFTFCPGTTITDIVKTYRLTGK